MARSRTVNESARPAASLPGSSRLAIWSASNAAGNRRAGLGAWTSAAGFDPIAFDLSR